MKQDKGKSNSKNYINLYTIDLRSIFEGICLPILEENIDKEAWKICSEFNYGSLTITINAGFDLKSKTLSLLVTFPHGVPDDQIPCLLDLIERFNSQMGELSPVTLYPTNQYLCLGEDIYTGYSYFFRVQLEPFLHKLFSKAHQLYRLVEKVIKKNMPIEEAMEGIWYHS